MIDHVCLIVNNLEESRKYYERILNMENRESNTDSKTILLENKEVHFFIIERDFPREYIEMQNAAYINSNRINRDKEAGIGGKRDN